MQASTIASYIIAFSQEHGDPVSNLKLQKLLYYAQAWHLAINDRPLFDEQIEAWVHGPVVPSVYREYKQFSWQPIAAAVVEPKLEKDVVDHLDEVMEVYGSLTALKLEQLTHAEYPWQHARGNLPEDASSNAVITHDDMKAYYRKRLDVADQAGAPGL